MIKDLNSIAKDTNKFLKKITDNLENFSYNKIIANLHEMYSFLSKQINKNYKKNTLIENYQKILIAMTPVIPHFSNECLVMMDSKETAWPSYDQSLLKENIVNIVIQINGKKRGLIKTQPNISEENLLNKIKSLGKIKKDMIQRAQIYWLTTLGLFYNSHEFLPKIKQHGLFKKKLFFEKISRIKIHRYKRGSFTDDIFYQIKNKNRHSLNSSFYLKHKKKHNLKLNDI